MINRTVLVGRLTKDPELKYTPSGVANATFTLAVNRTFSNQQGEREADFIRVIVWRKADENTANFLKKGSLAGVEGRIQTGSYEGQDVKRVFTFDIVADSVQFLEPKSNNEQGSNSNQSQQPSNNGGAPGGQYNQQSHQPNTQQNQYSNQNQQPQFAGNVGGGQQYGSQQQTPYFNDYPNNGPIEVQDDDLPF